MKNNDELISKILELAKSRHDHENGYDLFCLLEKIEELLEGEK